MVLISSREPPVPEHLPSRSSSWFGERAASEMLGVSGMPGMCSGGKGTKGKFPGLSYSSGQGLQHEGLDLVKQERRV